LPHANFSETARGKKEIETLELRSEDLVKAAERIARGTKKAERSPLVRVVPIGKVTEDETKLLYQQARTQIMIFTRAFEYLPRVIDELASANLKKTAIRVQFLDFFKLKTVARGVQRKMLSVLNARAPTVEIRFARSSTSERSLIQKVKQRRYSTPKSLMCPFSCGRPA
jgi:hypothetical protein